MKTVCTLKYSEHRRDPPAPPWQVFAGEKTDVAVNGYVSNHRGIYLEWRTRSTGFYSSIKQLRTLTAQADSPWVALDQLPEDAMLSQFADRLLISLRTDWRGFAGGALLDASTAEVMELGAEKVSISQPHVWFHCNFPHDFPLRFSRR